MIGKNGKRRELFSLDSFLGKALCVLLVLILTVGAFLAPKLISNLYDTGTLMQITYMDMDLSPYAVNYLTMEDKLQAIARVRTAGGSLSVLPAGEEASEAESDAELAEIVREEINEVGGGLNLFVVEGWWVTLTEGNLVSRTKYTLYGRPEGDGGDTSQEMAPFQFWVLQFARDEEEGTAESADRKDVVTDMDAENKYAAEPYYATDRLVVCLDADFHKIYGAAFAGDPETIEYMYGWNLPELFNVDMDRAVEWAPNAGRQELKMDLTGELLAYWADYWDITPDEQIYYADKQNALTGAMLYRSAEETEDGEVTDVKVSVQGAAAATDAERYVDIISMDGMDYEQRHEVMQAIEEFESMGAGVVYNYQTDEALISTPEDMEQTEFWPEGTVGLSVGSQGQVIWDEEDRPTWIQKTGCSEFFEMMQF